MKENLHFCVELAGTYWQKQPQYSILVNDTEIKRDTVVTLSEESFRVEFDVEVVAGP